MPEPGVVYRGAKYNHGPEGQYRTMGSMGTYDIEGTRPPSDKSLLRRGDPVDSDNEETKVNMCELVLVPWVLLALVLGCYLIAGANGQIAVLWIMPLVLTMLILAYVRTSYRRGDSDEVVLGFLALTAVVIGAAVGLFANFFMLQELHRINQGASYFNVLPSELASAHGDASSMVFVNGTRLNLAESFGFTDANSQLSTVYCVAPVTNGEPSFKHIQYWAAGIDCCGQTKPFTCGDAQNPTAQGGLRLSPFVEDSSTKKLFEQAIKGSLDKFGLVAGNEYILLSWTENPIQYRDNLWYGSWKLFSVFAGVYLIISAMVGFVIFPILKGS